MKIQSRSLVTRRIFGWLIALLLVIGFVGFAGTGRLMAQGITTGSITGTVVDPQGAVIPGATLTATNAATGVKLTTTSLSNGTFSFRAVPIGEYSVDLTATGFNAGNIASVGVVAGVATDLKMVKLGLSSSAQRVEVSGGTSPLLQVSESQVTTTFGAQTMANVPLNNAFDTITEVIPGVVSAHDDSFSNNNGDEFVVNGQSSRFNNFELDGQNNNDNTIGGPQLFFGNQDAIAEIQVITNDYSAQYGRDSGAVVNYITKSGTNSFHGSAFEYYQGQFLSSLENQQKTPLFGFCLPGQNPDTGCTKPVVPRFVENRYGATLGGPVLKNKLFFFGSGYWDRQHPGSSPSTSTSLTPNAAGITQLANTFPGNNAVAILQSSGPLALPVGSPVSVGPVVPEDITGPGGVVATGVPFQFVQRFVASPYTDAEYLGRLDWQPTEKDHLFGRYFYQTSVAQAADGDIPSGGYVNVLGTTHSVGADWTHTFNSNWVDQLRYSFQQAVIGFEGGGDPNCTISNPTVCPPQVIFNDTSEGFGLNTAFPQGRVVKVTQVQNNATWTHGNQTILFGGEVDYQNTPTTGLFNYNGTFDFGTFSNFIQDAPVPGNPTSAALFLSNGDVTVKFKETDIAGYIEDDWKVTPTLTANIGLRWEYFSPFANVYHDLTVARESNPATAFWDPSLPLADRTFPKVNQFFKGFEPRLGFAWNPAFAQKVVVRGGYAINRDPAFYNIGLLAGSGAPIAIAGTIYCTGGSTCLPSGGKFTGGAVRALNLPLFPVGGDPRTLDQSTVPSNLVPPYTQTYTLAIDRQLGNAAVVEVRYTGSLTEKNFQSLDANPYLLPVYNDFPAFVPVSLCSDPNAVGVGRPNCNYGNVSEVTNGGWANYNGLQTNLTTRNLHGMTGTLSYTYSKGLDNATDAFASTGAGGSSIAFAQNPLNPDEGERGVSGNSFKHVVGAQFTYMVPELHTDHRLLARATNGFALTSLYRYSSGQPYTPYQPITLDGNTGDTSYCDGTFNGSSVAVGVDTCRLIRSNKSAPLSTVAYLNPYTGPLDVNGKPTLGTPVYVVYGSDGFTSPTTYYPGTPIDPTTAHWIINNKAYAQSVQNPYPGSSRGAQVGDNYSELDATIIKNTKITERVQLQLSLAAYNVLNQMFRGAPQTFVANPGTFGSFNFSSGTHIPGAAASGTRFILLGSKVIF